MGYFEDYIDSKIREGAYSLFDKGFALLKKGGESLKQKSLVLNLVTNIVVSLHFGEYPKAKYDKVNAEGVKRYCFIKKDDFDDIMYKFLIFELKKANAYKAELGFNTYDIAWELSKIGEIIYNSDIYNTDESELFQEQYLTNDEFLEFYKSYELASALDSIKACAVEEARAFITAASFLETTFILTRTVHEIIYYHLIGTGFGRSYHDFLKYNEVSLENALATAFKYIFFAYPYKNTDENDTEYISTITNRYSEFENYKNKIYSSENPLDHLMINRDYTYEELDPEIRAFYLEGNEDALEELKSLYDHFVILGNRYLNKLKLIVESIEANNNLYKGLARGKSGEDFTYEYLRSVMPRDWELLRNVNVAHNGEQRENDLILISNKGIFTIEVKNYMAGSITIKNDGKVIHDIGGNVANENYSVIEQSESHVAFITRFMEENSKINRKKWYEVVHGTVVISNNEMEIDNQSSYPIFRAALLRQYILNNFDDVFTDEEVQEIKDLLLSQAKADVKRKYLFINPDIDIAEYITMIQSNYVDFMSKYIYLLGNLDSTINLTGSVTLIPRVDDEGSTSYRTITSDTSLMLSNIDEENRDFIKKLLNI